MNFYHHGLRSTISNSRRRRHRHEPDLLSCAPTAGTSIQFWFEIGARHFKSLDLERLATGAAPIEKERCLDSQMPNAIKDFVTYFTWRPTVCVASGTVCRSPGIHKHIYMYICIIMYVYMYNYVCIYIYTKSLVHCPWLLPQLGFFHISSPIGRPEKLQRDAQLVCVFLCMMVFVVQLPRCNTSKCKDPQQTAWVAPWISGLKPQLLTYHRISKKCRFRSVLNGNLGVYNPMWKIWWVVLDEAA